MASPLPPLSPVSLASLPFLSIDSSATESHEAASKLVELSREIAVLGGRLSGELRPKLAEASRAVAKLVAHREASTKQLEEMRQRRLEAASEVRELSKRQLSQIRGLMRNPPEVVQRTFCATWILLNAKRCQNRRIPQMSDAMTWPLCQRMIADDNFVNRILEFDTAVLDEAPIVFHHLATHFFGLDVEAVQRDEVNSSRHTFEEESVALMLPQRISSSRCSSPALTSHGPPQRVPMKNGQTGEIGSKAGHPLSVERVSWACLPCGALARWMLELLLEHRARKALLASEATLAKATEHQSCVEHEFSALEARLIVAQRRLADAEDLASSRVEQAKTTSALNTEKIQPKFRRQCWINEVSIDWAAAADKVAAARRYDRNRKRPAINIGTFDDPVLRLSPGERSRATHRRVMFGRQTHSNSLPCLRHVEE